MNKGPILRNKYVLYWMQQSQRYEYNHALEHAINQANELNVPVVVYFGITDSFPDANERHYYFMLQGLQKTKKALATRGIQMVIQYQSPETGVLRLTRNASLLVMDRGYLRIQRRWRNHVAKNAPCHVVQVESDVVVPIETASSKEEYSAATIRHKIQKHLGAFLIPLRKSQVRKSSLRMKFDKFPIDNIDKAFGRLQIDHGVTKSNHFLGGTDNAKRLLKDFIRHKLDRFADQRNDPSEDMLSRMSPYLHFGQISPLYIALQIQNTQSPGKNAFLEELIIRRELSMNFVHYNPLYDSYKGLPEWSRKTLAEHKKDKRQYIYGLDQLEQAQTHDPYWNAAQREMAVKGKMHGYMRMYWGKKLIEWTKEPPTAFKIALYLNNKYEIDGRDPNGYAGVAWCFGKHDRPWPEREIFGNVRYMSADGLKRKFRIEKYVRRISSQDR